MALTKADLDEIALGGCGNPNCDHKHEAQPLLLLHQKCHKGEGVLVEYDFLLGIVRAKCKVCDRLVFEFIPQH